MTPPPNAATAEPSWCEAKIQPKTTGARAPKCSRHSARVGAVGEPAGEDRAGDVEDADDGEQPGGGGDRHAVVVRGRDEVRLHQPVGRHAADEKTTGQQPERPLLR